MHSSLLIFVLRAADDYLNKFFFKCVWEYIFNFQVSIDQFLSAARVRCKRGTTRQRALVHMKELLTAATRVGGATHLVAAVTSVLQHGPRYTLSSENNIFMVQCCLIVAVISTVYLKMFKFTQANIM